MSSINSFVRARMWPRFEKENIIKAMIHPALIWSFIKGRNDVELAKEHLAIHLRKVSKIVLPKNKLDPIEQVCNSIDICLNYCYHTQYLYLVCLYNHPKIVVETGVHYGVSSAFILQALDKTDGRLYSIDLPNITYDKDVGGHHIDILPPGEISGCSVPRELRKNWELIIGDSKRKLPLLLKSLDYIDIFHHDSAHTYDLMTFEFETVWPSIKPKGLLLSDDADWNNAFKDFCKKYHVDYCIYKGIGIARK